MDLDDADLSLLIKVIEKVYVPLFHLLGSRTVADEARRRVLVRNINAFAKLVRQLDALVQVKCSDTEEDSVAIPAGVELKENFSSLDEEYDYWQDRLVQTTMRRVGSARQSHLADQECKAEQRYVHYTLKLFRLLHPPVQMFGSKRRNFVPQAGYYVRALIYSIQSVALQPASKSGIHNQLADLIADNTKLLARWTLRSLDPGDLLKAEVEVIVETLRVWEHRWMESQLESVRKLTPQELADLFLATRCILDSIAVVQSFVREREELCQMVARIEEYYTRNQLLEAIRCQLELPITEIDIHLFQLENQVQFQEFVSNYRQVQCSIQTTIITAIGGLVDSCSAFEGLKLYRKMMNESTSNAWVILKDYLESSRRDKTYRLSIELRLTRKGFDVTDFLEKSRTSADNIDMARRLFERRLLFHRVKISLLDIFVSPSDWDQTPHTRKIQDLYIELAKYLQTTEDKLHQRWFQSVQKRAGQVMSLPILRKVADGYVTTLHNNFDNLWNETRLFLQTRFQVPYVCHVLLMRKPYLIHQGRVIVAILERLAAIVDQLTFFEFSVLRTSYSAVEDALNVGQRHVTWPSLCLLSYIDELLENVEHFQMLSEDVAVTTDVVNRRIADVLKHSRLPPAASATLTADEFFDGLRHSGDRFFEEICKMVTEIPPILLQVESLVCQSQTGSAAEMQDYYNYWDRQIYATVLRATLDRFQDLCDLLEAGSPQFHIRVSLNEAEIVIEPPLEGITWQIATVTDHWIKRSAIVPMWTEGTCHVRSDPGGGSSYLQRFQNEPALQDANQRALECSRVLVDKLLAETRKWHMCAELWSADKADAGRRLRLMNATLSDYDQQLRCYKSDWTRRVGLVPHRAAISCAVLDMEELGKSAVAHIDSWMKHLGQVWLDDINGKMEEIERLERRHAAEAHSHDGSVDVDVEILVGVVRESFHRLAYYSIQIPREMELALGRLTAKKRTRLRE